MNGVAEYGAGVLFLALFAGAVLIVIAGCVVYAADWVRARASGKRSGAARVVKLDVTGSAPYVREPVRRGPAHPYNALADETWLDDWWAVK